MQIAAEATKKEAEILAELKATSTNDYAKTKALYQQLAQLFPENESYKNKVAFFSDKVKEEEKTKQRKSKIETQFSAWDGSHKGLERMIKESMNDPDSYDHVGTTYWDLGDHIVVRTEFRGKNLFGGVVKNTVKAKVSLDGSNIQILEQR